MDITLHLSQELEHKLREKADNEGVSVANYIVNTLESQVNMQHSVLEKEMAFEEELLGKIMGLRSKLSHEFWDEYKKLSKKDDKGKLGKKGRKRLIELNDLKEETNAHLFELYTHLSKLRDTSLRSIMVEFGHQPV